MKNRNLGIECSALWSDSELFQRLSEGHVSFGLVSGLYTVVSCASELKQKKRLECKPCNIVFGIHCVVVSD